MIKQKEEEIPLFCFIHKILNKKILQGILRNILSNFILLKEGIPVFDGEYNIINYC